MGTWNIGHGYGPAYAQNLDVFKLADQSLLDDLVGETFVPSLDIQDFSKLKTVYDFSIFCLSCSE